MMKSQYIPEFFPDHPGLLWYTGRMEHQVLIRKATGELESFNPEKLADSLRRAGADEASVEEITDEIESWLEDGVTTRKIYSRAHSLLSRHKKSASARYKVKQALMELGSSGYPFEHFVGELFKRQGYEVEVGQVLEGCSITHEMDVIATANGVQHLVECKHSQIQGKYVSIQTPLYVHSRVNDIVNKRRGEDAYRGLTFHGWVATNTRFSSDSMQYAAYYGLKLLGWDYPAGQGIKDLIEREKIFPITVLANLAVKHRDYLLENGVVTCTELRDRLDLLDVLEVPEKRRNALKRELEMLV